MAANESAASISGPPGSLLVIVMPAESSHMACALGLKVIDNWQFAFGASATTHPDVVKSGLSDVMLEMVTVIVVDVFVIVSVIGAPVVPAICLGSSGNGSAAARTGVGVCCSGCRAGFPRRLFC